MEISRELPRFDSARVGVFLVILLMAIMSLVLDIPFQSDSISTTLLSVSFLGLTLQLAFLFLKQRRQNLSFWASVISSALICCLFLGIQSSQSLFLLLLLVNVLLLGLESGSLPATHLALATSGFYSFVIILNSSFSHFQDLLSLGLFNLAVFLVAALSGEFSERLKTTETAFEKTQDLLEDLGSRHRVLIQELPLGLIVWKQSGEVVEQNSLFEERFENILEWNLFFKNEILTRRNEEYFEIEKNLKLADEFRQIILRNRTLSSGHSQYFLTLMEDVTETRKLEFDLKQKEKMAAIGTLAAGIAHEIRNPLAGMSGSIELLSVKPNTEEDQKLFKIILREIDRLNRLITEFLEFSKPEKKYEDHVVLANILDGVVNFLETSTDRPAGLVIEKSYQSNRKMMGSSDKLRQAFLNIMINSLQALQKTEKPLLRIELSDFHDHQIKLSIRDNGSGMTEEVRKKMFEPFHTTKSKGTGLGLAITHKILDSHRATISVHSEVGGGTEFIMIFPCS